MRCFGKRTCCSSICSSLSQKQKYLDSLQRTYRTYRTYSKDEIFKDCRTNLKQWEKQTRKSFVSGSRCAFTFHSFRYHDGSKLKLSNRRPLNKYRIDFWEREKQYEKVVSYQQKQQMRENLLPNILWSKIKVNVSYCFVRNNNNLHFQCICIFEMVEIRFYFSTNINLSFIKD